MLILSEQMKLYLKHSHLKNYTLIYKVSETWPPSPQKQSLVNWMLE